MEERIVKLNAGGLNDVFKQYKGSEVVIKSDEPLEGWVKVSVGNNISYDFQLAMRIAERNAPVVVNEEFLPKTSDVLRETIRIINQLKSVARSVNYIKFIVGKMGTPVMSDYNEGECCIEFRKPTPVHSDNP